MADPTLRPNAQVDRYRKQAQRAIRQNPAMFPFQGTFRDDQGGTWDVNYNLRDPQQINRETIAAAEAAARQFDVAYRDLRVLTIDPEQALPAIGASIRYHNADGSFEGLAVILDWGQTGTYSGLTRGTCVLRR